MKTKIFETTTTRFCFLGCLIYYKFSATSSLVNHGGIGGTGHRIRRPPGKAGIAPTPPRGKRKNEAAANSSRISSLQLWRVQRIHITQSCLTMDIFSFKIFFLKTHNFLNVFSLGHVYLSVNLCRMMPFVIGRVWKFESGQ